MRVGFLLALFALTACGDARVGPSAESARAQLFRPRHDAALDCQLSPERCQKIYEGIVKLTVHPSATCQSVGWSAYARFVAPPGLGFRNGEPNDTLMWVYMIQGQSPSGWVSSDGYIYVSTSFWDHWWSGSAVMTGAAIAHEEGGHQSGLDGPYHNTGAGAYYAGLCAEY